MGSGRLQARVPPECGEFWPLERLPELRRALTELAMEKGCTEEEAELPLPPRRRRLCRGGAKSALSAAAAPC